ncbi:hypothetical protein LOD99_12211 [Oopsacas minuta]|uniref:AH domain-containing protein n=1 Tax=Oopsacas minuta TaxID=111878 RepID=A0AAV7JET5_9METZ|nr:hypothetical protein LOD99_12211 [Oopsacas minuta]
MAYSNPTEPPVVASAPFSSGGGQAGTPVDKLFQVPATHDPPHNATTMVIGRKPSGGTPGGGTRDAMGTGNNLKEYGTHQWKILKQYVNEKIGKASRTVDQRVDEEVIKLKETQLRYREILTLSNQYCTHLERLLQVQKSLSENFSQLALRDPDLRMLFEWNCETQKASCRQGEQLLLSIAHFSNALYTLSEKTIEDTNQTIRQYEAARVLYDACRGDLEIAELAQTQGKSVSKSKLDALQIELEKAREKFDKLKCDVTVKAKLLEENRLKVMSQQLRLLSKAFSTYYSGCYTSIEPILDAMEQNMDDMKHARNQSQMSLAIWLDTVNRKTSSNNIEDTNSV